MASVDFVLIIHDHLRRSLLFGFYQQNYENQPLILSLNQEIIVNPHMDKERVVESGMINKMQINGS